MVFAALVSLQPQHNIRNGLFTTQVRSLFSIGHCRVKSLGSKDGLWGLQNVLFFPYMALSTTRPSDSTPLQHTGILAVVQSDSSSVVPRPALPGNLLEVQFSKLPTTEILNQKLWGKAKLLNQGVTACYDMELRISASKVCILSLQKWFSNFNIYKNHLGSWLKQFPGNLPQRLWFSRDGGVWFVFLTSWQLMPVLPL